jgi:hypothetical protein
LGASPISTGGTADHPIRSLPGVVDGANIVTQEQLTEFEDYSGGAYLENKRLEDGFLERFELIDTPITYVGDSGPGSLGGAWDTVDVRKIGKGKTLWIWGIYACMSSPWSMNYPKMQRKAMFLTYIADFGQIHRGAISSISNTLEEAGKLRGETIGPFTI